MGSCLLRFVMSNLLSGFNPCCLSPAIYITCTPTSNLPNIDYFTVALHSLNNRHLPAGRTIQDDGLRVEIGGNLHQCVLVRLHWTVYVYIYIYIYIYIYNKMTPGAHNALQVTKFSAREQPPYIFILPLDTTIFWQHRFNPNPTERCSPQMFANGSPVYYVQHPTQSKPGGRRIVSGVWDMAPNFLT